MSSKKTRDDGLAPAKLMLRAICDSRGLRYTEKLVLVMIVMNVPPSGDAAEVSFAALAEQCGTTRRTVIRAVERLERNAGPLALEVERKAQDRNRYRVSLKAAP